MDNKFIGRKDELQFLQRIAQSGHAEFVAVYGRRRVGKTRLIQHFFNKSFDFEASGIIDGNRAEQLYSFTRSLIAAGYDGAQPTIWLEAFDALKDTLQSKRHDGRLVIYIDELPCFDTPKSDFFKALGYFWNTWASKRDDVMLVVCGSATSWMIDNIVNNHGGLHNRITHSINLKQFTLSETEEYLAAGKFNWSRSLVIETYMMFGGVPYYLSLLDNHETLPQNIDRLYFNSSGELRQEYKRLYSSLFRSPESYIKIIEALARHKQGMTRNEIAADVKLSTGGQLTARLSNLEHCGIIRSYITKSRGKAKTSNAYYQLVDLFTLFHLTFAKKISTDDYWQQHTITPAINNWRGLAFEHVCMVHINNIRQALGLTKIAVEYYSWRSNDLPKAQVDMVIERADRLINICEMKFAADTYTITADDNRQMRARMAAFKAQTKTRCGLIPTWITPYGLTDNQYSAEVTAQVTMDDLF